MVFCTTCGAKLEEHWMICPNCGTPMKKIIEPESEVILPPREIIPPYVPHQIIGDKKTKGKKKEAAIIIFMLVGFFITGISLGIMVPDPLLDQAREDRDYWHNEYDDLLNNYTQLFGDYQSIQNILYLAANPLTNPDTPTYNEVVDFLEADILDSYNYTENFMCGDFASMLIGRAKIVRNWRMRIACMFYSFEGDIGWEDSTDPYGSYGHAFNVILCQDIDGDGTEDWIYIEPQTDAIWGVVIGTDWYVHYEIWHTFTGGIEGTMWSEPYYINHYSYFA